jgi:uncharacterized tellurite resistance protein B-like protein
MIKAEDSTGCIVALKEHAMSDFFAANLSPRQTPSIAPENGLSWGALLETAPDSKSEWTAPEAFLAILFAAVTCDGDLAPVEHEELMALAHRSRALKTVNPKQLAELNISIVERMRRSDTMLRDACAALPAEMRLSAFSHALDLILADGEINRAEAAFLDQLSGGLDLALSEIERIADVLIAKNRY